MLQYSFLFSSELAAEGAVIIVVGVLADFNIILRLLPSDLFPEYAWQRIEYQSFLESQADIAEGEIESYSSLDIIHAH